MEIARNLKLSPSQVGVDIVFFDLEDQGTPEWDESDFQDQSDWCLGAQYWSKEYSRPILSSKIWYTIRYGWLFKSSFY